MKKVLIAGASGMIGALVLQKCLENKRITKVYSLVRKPNGNSHPKLEEFICTNFKDFDGCIDAFQDIDMAFFCIGVYTGSASRERFREITVDFPLAFAAMLKQYNKELRFCLLSGAGADRTEKSKMMFAKDKGRAENLICKLGLGEFYTFRPAYIYPVKKREEPNFSYKLMRFLYKPLISKLGKNMSVESTKLASAMVQVGLEGNSISILENRNILDVVFYD